MDSFTLESYANPSRLQTSQVALKARLQASARSPLTERENASQLDSSCCKRKHDDSEAEDEAKSPQPSKRLRLTVEPSYSKGLRDGGAVVVGNGKFSATVRELIHEEKDSAYFFKGPIKQVKHNPDYLKQATTLNLIKEGVVVKTSDGTPMIYMIKQGMLTGMMADTAKKLASQSEQSLRDLTAAYKPEVPANDPKASSRGKRGMAQKRPGLRSLSFRVMAYAVSYNTAWEHEIQSSWLEALNYPVWQEYHNSYQGLREDLEHLYQGPRGCQSSLAVIINMTVGPHKDKGDVKDGFVAITCYGNFEGAHAVFPELDTKLDQRPGDILFAMSAVSIHYITPIESGERQSHVRFTKADILHSHKKIFECPIEGCGNGYKTDSSVKRHLLSKKRSGHALDKAKVDELMSKVKPKVNKRREAEASDRKTVKRIENVTRS